MTATPPPSPNPPASRPGYWTSSAPTSADPAGSPSEIPCAKDGARGDRQHDHSPTRGPQGLTDGILILGSGGAVPGAPPEPFKLLARRHGHVPDTARTRQAADLYVRGGRHAGERDELGAGSGAVRSVPSRAEVTVVAPRADGALGHAGVLGLQHHADAAGAEIGVEALGDLHRQPLLWVWGRAAKRSTGRAS